MPPKLEQTILQRLPPTLRNRLIHASRQNKQILHGIAWVTLFVLAAKIVAALKEILVAQKYGTSAVLDGYLLAFNLASLPISLFYGVAGLVAIPVLVQWRKADPVACASFERQMHAAAWMLGLGMAILAFWTLPTVIRLPLLGLPLEIQQPALASTPWMVIVAPLGIAAAWYSVQLMSLQRHANSFLDSMPSIGIAILLLWPGWRSDALVPLLWGSVAGFGAQAIMAGILAHRAGASVGLALPRLIPQWRTIGRGFGIALAAQIVMMFTAIVDQILLARLPEGSLATFAYASRLVALILNLSALVIGRAMLPALSDAGNARDVRILAQRWSQLLALIGLIAWLMLLVVGRPLVALLFERGAFSAHDTAAVSGVLIVLAAQLPFYLGGIVLVQGIGAIRKSSVLLIAAVIGLFTKLAIVALLAEHGIIAVAASTVGMYAATSFTIAAGFFGHTAERRR